MAQEDFIIKGELNKVDMGHKTAYGWAYVAKVGEDIVVDHSGDTWDIEEIVKTAHEFVMECREGGEAHIWKGGATLVESLVFTKDIQKALDIDLGKEGWFVGFRITDSALLEKIQKGDYAMFSIGGTGTRETIEE